MIRSALVTALRVRLRDTDTVNPRLSNTYLQGLLDRGIKRLAAKYQFIEKVAGIVTDGVQWIYDLIGSAPYNLATDYLGMGQVTHVDMGTLTRVDQRMVEDTEQADLLTDDSPLKYALFKNAIYFDRIPDVATELIGDSDSRDFTAGVGDWVAGGDSGLTAEVGVGTLAPGSEATTTVMSLTTGTTDLVVGKHYVLSLDMAKGETWSGGNVTVTIGSIYTNSVTVTLTTTLTQAVIKLQAKETNADIVITSATVAGQTDHPFQIDNVNLKRATVWSSYYAWETLSSDSAEPPFPLNVLDGLVLAAAMREHADDFGKPTLIALAESQMQALEPEFRMLVESKGKHQKRQARAHRL